MRRDISLFFRAFQQQDFPGHQQYFESENALGLQNQLGDPSEPIICSSLRLSHVTALPALRQFHVGNSYSITRWKLASGPL